MLNRSEIPKSKPCSQEFEDFDPGGQPRFVHGNIVVGKGAGHIYSAFALGGDAFEEFDSVFRKIGVPSEATNAGG